jgi:hypothetical protein
MWEAWLAEDAHYQLKQDTSSISLCIMHFVDRSMSPSEHMCTQHYCLQALPTSLMATPSGR